MQEDILDILPSFAAGIHVRCIKLGPPAQKGCGCQSRAKEKEKAVTAGPEEGHKDDPGAGAPLLWRRAERTGEVRHTEEKTPGRPHCGLSVIKGVL